MRFLLPLLLIISSVISAPIDPIEALVQKLSENHFWRNGSYPIIELPNDSDPKAILASYFDKISFDDGSRIATFQIKQFKNVKIKGSLPDDYVAILCETDHGNKIILMQFWDEAGWWIRLYDTA